MFSKPQVKHDAHAQSHINKAFVILAHSAMHVQRVVGPVRGLTALMAKAVARQIRQLRAFVLVQHLITVKAEELWQDLVGPPGARLPTGFTSNPGGSLKPLAACRQAR